MATLTMQRPGDMNSLTPELLDELREITAELRSSKDVWVVVVQGAGQHFSAGMDVGVIRDRLGRPEKENRSFLRGLQQCLDDFEALEKPTIAKIRGFCLGGGLIMALCCDFRVASNRAIFGLPEVKLGLAVMMGTQRVTRTVGMAATKELILLGGRLRASEAHRLGLVHEVAAPGELDKSVEALVKRLLSLPPRTVGIAKRIINKGMSMSLRESQDLELDAQAVLLDSPDAREAIVSFLEKRRPRFVGE